MELKKFPAEKQLCLSLRLSFFGHILDGKSIYLRVVDIIVAVEIFYW